MQFKESSTCETLSATYEAILVPAMILSCQSTHLKIQNPICDLNNKNKGILRAIREIPVKLLYYCSYGRNYEVPI